MSSSGGGNAATVTYSDITDIGSGNLGITVGNATLNVPAAVVYGLTPDDITSRLQLTQKPIDAEKLSTLKTLIPAQNAIVASIDLNLIKIYSNGTSVVIHQLGGKIKVTLLLTDDQIAKIMDKSKAKLYYLNIETNALEPVDATFDFSGKAVTFYTDHFCTYIIGTSASSSGMVTIPKTGDKQPFAVGLTALLAFASAVVIIFRRRKLYR